MDSGVSPGEIGGIFAGVIALLASLGKALKWLLDWKGAREESQAARLKAWEDSLDRREREMREQTETRLHAIERKLSVVSAALLETVAELQVLDATSPALAKARLVLQQAYPLDAETSPEIEALVSRIGRSAGGQS